MSKRRILALSMLLLCCLTACKSVQDNKLAQTQSPNEMTIAQEDESSIKNPIVTIEMENGDIIKAELYPEIAPNTVANFVILIQEGYYDGLTFHRLIPGFMVQGGCPQGNGLGNPGYAIKGEFSSNNVQNNLLHERGVLSMARAGGQPDSAGSQFFIMTDKAADLDGDYAAFGKVLDEESLKAVDTIVGNKTVRTELMAGVKQNEIKVIDANGENVPLYQGIEDRPLKPVIIKSMTVETFGVTYTVEKIK